MQPPLQGPRAESRLPSESSRVGVGLCGEAQGAWPMVPKTNGKRTDRSPPGLAASPLCRPHRLPRAGLLPSLADLFREERRRSRANASGFSSPRSEPGRHAPGGFINGRQDLGSTFSFPALKVFEICCLFYMYDTSQGQVLRSRPWLQVPRSRGRGRRWPLAGAVTMSRPRALRPRSAPRFLAKQLPTPCLAGGLAVGLALVWRVPTRSSL